MPKGIPDKHRADFARQAVEDGIDSSLWEVNILPDGNFSLILSITPGTAQMAQLRKFEGSTYCRNGFSRYDRRVDADGKIILEITDPEVLNALADYNLAALVHFKALSSSKSSESATPTDESTGISSSSVAAAQVRTEKEKLTALEIWELCNRYYHELVREHGDEVQEVPQFEFLTGFKEVLGLEDTKGVLLTQEQVIDKLQAEKTASIEKKLVQLKKFLDEISDEGNLDSSEKEMMAELKNDKKFEKLLDDVVAKLESIKPASADVKTSTSTVMSQLTSPSQKKISDFYGVKELSDVDASGKKSHDVMISKKEFTPQDMTEAEAQAIPEDLEQRPKYQYQWYLKLVTDLKVANTEVVAQELFRLFIPNHAKTRLAVDGKGGIVIASKEVPGFQSLGKMDPVELRDNLLKGDYKGLGEVMIMALWLNESDLKLGNMGVDKDGKVVKIDGDWCLAQLRRSDRKMTITEQTLQDLPLNSDINPYNWLDKIREGRLQTSPVIANTFLWLTPNFCQGVNETILKVLLMPENSLREFVNYYVDDAAHADKIINLILERQLQLRHAAIQNESFREYMKTDEADKLARSFVAQLDGFTLTGKHRLDNSGRMDTIIRKYESIRTDISNVAQAPLRQHSSVTQASSTGSAPKPSGTV